MHSNYDWQRQQANEKIRKFQQDANLHRKVKQEKIDEESSLNKTALSIIIFLFLIIIGYLMPN